MLQIWGWELQNRIAVSTLCCFGLQHGHQGCWSSVAVREEVVCCGSNFLLSGREEPRLKQLGEAAGRYIRLLAVSFSPLLEAVTWPPLPHGVAASSSLHPLHFFLPLYTFCLPASHFAAFATASLAWRLPLSEGQVRLNTILWLEKGGGYANPDSMPSETP